MQLDQIWKQLLVQLEPHINRQSFETWLKPTSLVSISGKDVHVAVPNRFFGEWIKEHYYPQMQEALEKELAEEGLRIHFVVDEKERPPDLLNARDEKETSTRVTLLIRSSSDRVISSPMPLPERSRNGLAPHTIRSFSTAGSDLARPIF